jgi:hypothetical protein
MSFSFRVAIVRPARRLAMSGTRQQSMTASHPEARRGTFYGQADADPAFSGEEFHQTCCCWLDQFLPMLDPDMATVIYEGAPMDLADDR